MISKKVSKISPQCHPTNAVKQFFQLNIQNIVLQTADNTTIEHILFISTADNSKLQSSFKSFNSINDIYEKLLHIPHTHNTSHKISKFSSITHRRTRKTDDVRTLNNTYANILSLRRVKWSIVNEWDIF